MKKTILAAMCVIVSFFGCSERSNAQATPGVFADANHPSGAPDPEKLDDIWTVDPISGQVSINIPFTTTPQGGRGPKIPFALLYNSASTVTLQTVGTYSLGAGAQTTNFSWSAHPIIMANSPVSPTGPWTTTGPYFYQAAPTDVADVYEPCGNGETCPTPQFVGCSVSGGYNLTDSSGSTHDLNLLSFSSQSEFAQEAEDKQLNWVPICTGAQSSGSSTNYWPSSFTSDGSAMQTSNGGATEPDGTTVSGGATLNSSLAIGSFSSQMTDSNGNKATLTLSGSVYTATDALGRTIYQTNIPIGLPGAIPAGSYYVTTYGASGAAETYTITFSTEGIGSFTLPHPNTANNEIESASYCLTCNSYYAVGKPSSSDSFTAISSITRPDGSSYTFTYDPLYGNVQQISFPTGGNVNFIWGVRTNSIPYGQFAAISDVVIQSVTTSTGSSTVGTWTYNIASYVSGQAPSSTVTAPDGSYTKYTGACFVYTSVPFYAAQARPSCKEASHATYSGSGKLMKSVAETFGIGALPAMVVTSLYDGPTPMQQATLNTYDSWSNVIEKDESDYYSCSLSGGLCPIPSSNPPWLRKTFTSYAYTSSSTMASAHIVNKPSQVTVTDGNGNPYALANYTYSTDGHGNLLNESKCLSISGTGSSATCSAAWQTQFTYDSTGQMLTKTEGYGTTQAATTTNTWGGQNNGFLLSVKQPNGMNDSYTYFTPSGAVNTHTDWNNNVTTYAYADAMNRITSITLPATVDGTTGSTGNGTTTYSYTDTPGSFSVQEQHTLNTSGTSTSTTKYYDGLGRFSSSSTAVPTSQCNTGRQLAATTYDSMNRASTVSNPYCSFYDSTYGLTQYTYDALGRKIQTTLPDGSISTIAFAGNATKTTDPSNGTTTVQHIQQANGLGQLTGVCEVSSSSLGGVAPSSCGLNITGTGYLTAYSYDVLGNLLKVNQYGLSRLFMYDSLSRLVTSLNPEAGSTTYTYSTSTAACSPDSGALCTKTDARGVVASFQYDILGRLTGKSYSVAATNTIGALSDLSSCFQYDTKLSTATDSNPKGQLTAEWQHAGSCPTSAVTSIPSGSVGVRIYSKHDAAGGVGLDQQCLTAASCSSTVGDFVYSYNLAGMPVQANNGIAASSVSATQTCTANSSAATAPSLTWDSAYTVSGSLSSATVQDQPSAFSQQLYKLGSTVLQATNYDAFGHVTNANVGAACSSTGNALSTVSQYDNRSRIVAEASGSGGTPASTVLTVSGSDGSTQVCYTVQGEYGSQQVCNTVPNSGTISITIGGFTAESGYGPMTDSQIATNIASAFNFTGSPFVATASGNSVAITSIAVGPSSNYPITISDSGGVTVSDPNAAMTGGAWSSLYSFQIPSGGFAPSGEVLAANDSIIGDWKYSYDAVDRLASAQNVSTTAFAPQYAGIYGCWTYDSYGNRLSESMSATACASSPAKASWATYNAANNRMLTSMAAPGGVTYDAAGDVLNDGLNKYWYDAEGRLCATQSIRTTGATIYQYVYDAFGARIAKGTLASAPGPTASCAAPLASGFTLSSRYLVDLDGNQVSELNGAGAWQHSNLFAGGKLAATYDAKGIHYELADWLGTKRMQVNALGQVDESCTGLPFGNDIGNPASVNCAQVANSLATADDATEHHFTGKERDAESGNDDFGARYYSSAMGRWLSPDWSAKVEPVPYAKMGDPQSLNLYAYVGNDPISLFDPDGHDGCDGWSCEGLVDKNSAAQNEIAQNAAVAEQKAKAPAQQQAHQPVVRFEGSQTERTQLKRSWHHMITHSANARADLKTALKQHGDLTIRPATGDNPAYSDPRDNSINIDPNFHPITQTTAGPQPAPTEAIMGHELGHRAGGHDDGPGNMNNVNQHENPVRHDLGLPDRTEY